jgi:inorganic pyrophosphatase
MDTDLNFWLALDRLVATSRLRLDRPKGSAHPRYPDFIYPLDYGYLENTHAMDGGGVDVWVGSLPERALTAIICTVDLLKRDTELKLLLGCTAEEQQTILRTHKGVFQSAMLCVRRPRPQTVTTDDVVADQ